MPELHLRWPAQRREALVTITVALLALAALAWLGPGARAQTAAPGPRVHGVPAVSDLDAAARAAGNRKQEAYQLGRALFATVWPAQILKVRVDAVGSHQVAGLLLSGVKFHHGLDVDGFAAEVGEIARRSFASSPVEEVDIWAVVPLPIDKATAKTLVVSGDYAQPTAKTVFAVTVLRSAAATLDGRVRRGSGVFWDPDWKALLAGKGPGLSSANPDMSAHWGPA
ncbi:MAG: hypothetical protein ACLPYS_04805 [Vulcanimicrobiaceae bacterium]